MNGNLVLSRHKGESIVIADEIVVTVVEIRGDKVRLSVAAPKTVLVDRQEVHERRKQFAPTTTAAAPATQETTDAHAA